MQIIEAPIYVEFPFTKIVFYFPSQEKEEIVWLKRVDSRINKIIQYRMPTMYGL